MEVKGGGRRGGCKVGVAMVVRVWKSDYKRCNLLKIIWRMKKRWILISQGEDFIPWTFPLNRIPYVFRKVKPLLSAFYLPTSKSFFHRLFSFIVIKFKYQFSKFLPKRICFQFKKEKFNSHTSSFLVPGRPLRSPLLTPSLHFSVPSVLTIPFSSFRSPSSSSPLPPQPRSRSF